MVISIDSQHVKNGEFMHSYREIICNFIKDMSDVPNMSDMPNMSDVPDMSDVPKVSKLSKKERHQKYTSIKMFCLQMIATLILSEYSALAHDKYWDVGTTWGMMDIGELRQMIIDFHSESVSPSNHACDGNDDAIQGATYDLCKPHLFDRDSETKRIEVPDFAIAHLSSILNSITGTGEWQSMEHQFNDILGEFSSKKFSDIVKPKDLIECAFFTLIDLNIQESNPMERSDCETITIRRVDGIIRRRIEDCLIMKINRPYAAVIANTVKDIMGVNGISLAPSVPCVRG